MIERIEGIVTDIIKHSDRHNIVTLYTRQRGRIAFAVPVGKTRAGMMRNAVLSLMAAVSADVNIRGDRELQTLRQVQPVRLWHGIYGNPLKSSLLFFMAEFCNRLIRQYPADERLWAFLMEALEELDAMPAPRAANFPLAFLIRLLPIVGIEPPASRWEPGDRFDMLTGEMAAECHTRTALAEEESRHVPLLLRMTFGNHHRFRFTRSERNRALDLILAYYSTHLPLGGSMKTIPVLREYFS